MKNNLTNNNIDMKDYPNALAHLKVYPQTQHIEFIDIDTNNVDTYDVETEQNMAPRKKNTKSSKKGKNIDNKSLEMMWKLMSMGKIDISYACVGYAFDGRPVLDYTAFIDLLINYGFYIDDVLTFIDDFSSCAKNDPKAPIVMTNINTARIMTEIKPLVEKK